MTPPIWGSGDDTRTASFGWDAVGQQWSATSGTSASRTVGWATLTLDVTTVVLGAVLAASVIGDLALSVRWPVAAVFSCWAPGWTLARLAGFKASGLSLLGSLALSLALVILGGQVLVVTDWSAWRVAVVALASAVAVLESRAARRGWLELVR